MLLKTWGNATNRASIIASENPTRSSASLSEAKCHAVDRELLDVALLENFFHPLGEKTVTYGPPWRQFDKARVGPKIVRRMVGMGALVKAFRRHKKMCFHMPDAGRITVDEQELRQVAGSDKSMPRT
jgi:hypothetical protein